MKDRPNSYLRVHPVTTFSGRVEYAGFGGHQIQEGASIGMCGNWKVGTYENV